MEIAVQRRGLALAGLMLLANLGLAVGNDPLKSELTVWRVTTAADGHEQLERAERTKPGELLEYRLTYTNTGAREIVGLKARLPLPATTALVANTARPGGVWASLDGQTFKPAPLRREVRDAQGHAQTVDVPAAEYRALQWQVPRLGSGQSVVLTARVKVLTRDDAR